MKLALDGPHVAHLAGGPLDGHLCEVRGTRLVPWPEPGGHYEYSYTLVLVGDAVLPLFIGTWMAEPVGTLYLQPKEE